MFAIAALHFFSVACAQGSRDPGKALLQAANDDSGAGLPDAGEPDAGAPDGGLPDDGGVPDAGLPDGGLSDGGLPDGGGPFSDEFDDSATLSRWQILPPGTTQFDVDINVSTRGYLTLVPTAVSYWYDGNHGPFLYQLVGGDFVVATSVIARNLNDPSRPPDRSFNSAGLLARDPASAPESENWVMLDTGRQEVFVGYEGKTTVNSASVLDLIPGANNGELRICRLGSTLHMFRRLGDDPSLTETETYEREDLPQMLQVGLIANAYEGPPDLRAEFDYVRYTRPATFADCTAVIGP